MVLPLALLPALVLAGGGGGAEGFRVDFDFGFVRGWMYWDIFSSSS